MKNKYNQDAMAKRNSIQEDGKNDFQKTRDETTTAIHRQQRVLLNTGRL